MVFKTLRVYNSRKYRNGYLSVCIRIFVAGIMKKTAHQFDIAMILHFYHFYQQIPVEHPALQYSDCLQDAVAEMR